MHSDTMAIVTEVIRWRPDGNRLAYTTYDVDVEDAIINNKVHILNPVPRPFYCTMYWDYPLNPPLGHIPGGADKFTAHDWYFFTMPNQVSTGNTALDALYVDPFWGWGANQ